MNLPYIVILLNGLDNITTYLMLGTGKVYELNPIQRHIIHELGLFQTQVVDFLLFGIIIVYLSHFLYKKLKVGYYVLNGLLLVGFVVTVVNNLLLTL